jgi:hypothetical protein
LILTSQKGFGPLCVIKKQQCFELYGAGGD